MGLYDNYKPEKKETPKAEISNPAKTGGLYANYKPEKKQDVPHIFTEEEKKYVVTNPSPKFKAEIDAIEKENQDKINKIWTGGGIKILSPLVGLGLAPVTGGMSVPAAMAITGGTEGLVYGLGDSVEKDKKGLNFVTNAGKEGLIGGGLGAGFGAISKLSRKLLNNKAAFDTIKKITNENPAPNVSRAVPKIVDNSAEYLPEITEQPIREIATNAPNKTFELGLQADADIPPIIPPNNTKLVTLGDDLPVPQNNSLIPEAIASGGGNIPPKKPTVNVEAPNEFPMNQGETSPTEFINQGEHTGQKIRQGYTTLDNSAFGQDEAFMQSVEGSKMYDTITNKDTLQKAVNLNDEEAKKILSSKDPSALRTMTNFLKLGQALSAEDRIAAETLGNMYIRRGTDIAQEQQARSIVKKLSPEGAVLAMIRVNRESTPRLAQNLIDNADDVVNNPELINEIVKNTPKKLKNKILNEAKNGKLTKEKYLSEIDKFYKTKGITQEDIQKAKALTEKIQSSTGREQEIAIGQLRALIASKKPVSLGRKISTVQSMAQLLNPKTISRNIIGNQLYQGLENITQLPAVGIDKIVSKATGQRSVALPNAKTQMVEGAKGAKHAFEDIMLGIDTTGNSKFDLYPTNTFKNPVMNTLEKALSLSLRVPDRFAYEGAKADIINGFKQLGNKITPEIEAYAEELARKKTFQDDSALAKMTTGLKENLNFGKDFGLGDILIKYAKTPANLISRGLSYSPIGLAKGGIELGQLLKSGQIGDLVGVTAQNKAVGDIARGLVGTGITGAGYLGAKNGVINNSMKDSDFRGTMELQAGNKEAGIQPNSINFGNTNYTYDWAQPMSIPLSAGVNLANQDSLGLLESIASGTDTIVEQPLLQGIANFAGNLREGGDIGQSLLKTASDVPASFTPGILNQINQLADNNVRETYDPNPIKQGLNKVIARTPILSQTLPIRPNIKGRNTERYQNDSNNILNVMFNPGFVREKQDDPVLNKLVDIYKSTGETKQLMPIVKKKIMVNGKPKKLSQAEYINYQKQTGELLYDKLKNSVFTNEDFNNATENEQIKVINNVQSDINAALMFKLFNHKPKKGLDRYARQYLDKIK